MTAVQSRTHQNTQRHHAHHMILVLTIILAVFGLLMIWSAGAVYADTRFGSEWFFVRQQFVGVIIGFVALIIVQRIDYHAWRRVAATGIVGAFLLLVLVFIPGIGQTVYGATRWIAIGPLSFQPAEIFKIALVLYLATWCSTRPLRAVQDFYEGLVPFMTIIGLATLLIMLQPDMGTLGVIVVTGTAIYFAAGARLSHLGGLVATGIVLVGVLIKIEPYRMGRLLVFLNPDLDPQGMGYQVTQALIAVGSGGFFGRGLGHSIQKFNYLPEPVGDSIFAVLSEDVGFVGAGLVVCMFGLFAYYGYRIAWRAPDLFGRLIAVGITTWIVTQALFNMAAITALMPLTGIPLPFISYGSTALVIIMTAVGILLNIGQQERV